MINDFCHEVKVLSKCKGKEGVVQMLGCGKTAEITDEDGDIRKCPYILMEYCPQSTLFDLHEKLRRFGEKEGRYFLKKMLKSLKILHDKRIAHLDIKPENILIDDEFNPKFADFGLSYID